MTDVADQLFKIAMLRNFTSLAGNIPGGSTTHRVVLPHRVENVQTFVHAEWTAHLQRKLRTAHDQTNVR